MASRSESATMRIASRTLSALAGSLLLGCVSGNAGYDDVRELTAARLGKAPRWQTHDSRGPADAETKKLLESPLTADAAVALCLANNQALQASFEKLGIARAEWVHALSLPNPSVGAGVRWGPDDHTEIDVDATLSLTQLLFMPWKSGAAAAQLDATELEVVGEIAEFAFATRVGFFAYQAAVQQLELWKSVLTSARASRDLAESLHRAGNITDLNLASERALYEEARIAMSRAEARLRAEREQLNARMGLVGERAARWTPVPRLAEPQPVSGLVANLENRSVARSLDLELYRRRFRAAERQLTVARLEGWVPELRAGVSAEHSEPGWGIGPRAELEVPLFYQGQGHAAAATAELRRQRNLFDDRDAELRARARALASLLTESATSLGYYRSTLLPLREEIVRQTQLEYNAMSIGFFQLLQAKREQIQSAQAYVELLREYWTQRSEVEALLAGVLPRSAATLADPALPSAAAPASASPH